MSGSYHNADDQARWLQVEVIDDHVLRAVVDWKVLWPSGCFQSAPFLVSRLEFEGLQEMGVGGDGMTTRNVAGLALLSSRPP